MLTNIKMCWIISVGVVQLPATTFINIYNFFPTHPNIVLVVAGGKSCYQDFAKFHSTQVKGLFEPNQPLIMIFVDKHPNFTSIPGLNTHLE